MATDIIEERLFRKQFAITTFVTTVFLLWLFWDTLVFAAFDGGNVQEIALRIAYCFLFGMFGLSLRAFYLLESGFDFSHEDPKKKFKDYLMLRPIIIFIGSLLVFSLVGTSDYAKTGWLFYTSAAPLCILVGFFCQEWFFQLPMRILGKFVE